MMLLNDVRIWCFDINFRLTLSEFLFDCNFIPNAKKSKTNIIEHKKTRTRAKLTYFGSLKL